MTYHKLPDTEKERIFAEDVLENKLEYIYGNHYKFWEPSRLSKNGMTPLSDLRVAMLGVEKLKSKHNFRLIYNGIRWRASFLLSLISHISGIGDTPNEAIVEACIRIVRPDLFEGE